MHRALLRLDAGEVLAVEADLAAVASISLFATPAIFSGKAMFCATLMCGNSA